MAMLNVLRRFRLTRVRLETGGQAVVHSTPFVFVGNNEYTIDGSRLGSRERLDEGMLFVYMAPRLRARHLPLLLGKALVGRARQSGEFEIVRATELWIDRARSGRAQHVALDGEVRIMGTPLHYQMRPGVLQVLVPPKLT
jgi:diacylglycerol kinase family enzyme